MRITIDTNILSRNNISLGEFLILLLGYNNCNFDECFGSLVDKKLADIDKFTMGGIILSGNSKELVTRLLTEADERLNKSPVKDFYVLARKLMNIYPSGNKSGTSYLWGGTLEEIAQKLMVLVTVHGFIYTEDEAIKATKEYVDSFEGDRSHMKLLKYFLLRTRRTEQEIDSDFMTIIEKNRDENNNR